MLAEAGLPELCEGTYEGENYEGAKWNTTPATTEAIMGLMGESC